MCCTHAQQGAALAGHATGLYEAEGDTRSSALQEVSAKVEAPLKLAAPFDQYVLPAEGFHQLGLAGAHQRINASLAVQLAAAWEQSAGPSCGGHAAAGAAERAQQVAQLQLPDAYAAGLRDCVWPGRAQVLRTIAHPPITHSYLHSWLPHAHLRCAMQQDCQRNYATITAASSLKA